MYPPSYFRAINAVIRDSDSDARDLIAKALRDLRNTHSVWSGRANRQISGREWARHERAHLQFVNVAPWLKPTQRPKEVQS